MSRIKSNIDKNINNEEKAKQAFLLRNRIRTTAREMMNDEKRRVELYEKSKNPTFEQLIESKMKRKNMTREEAAQDIFETATKTNENVNRDFGIGGE